MTEKSSLPNVRLVLKNEKFELERLTAVFDEFAGRHQISDQPRFQLQLCLEETVLNVINYGFGDGTKHEIHVDFEFQIDSRTVTVNILDDGRPFNPLTEVPVPDIESKLEDRTIGGLGVHFVRTFMDAADYRHEDGKNRLTLAKNVGK